MLVTIWFLVGCPLTRMSAPRESGVGAEMVAIPGGVFGMGTDNPNANRDERPMHSVTVRDFSLDRTEVTVAAFGRCVAAGSCSEPEAYRDGRRDYRVFCNWKHPADRSTHPVNCVDFGQATAERVGGQTVALRGGMGIRGQGWRRRPAFSMGERSFG